MKIENEILFSIIVPTYNRAHMISTAIESVLAQTYKNWELIIVNDGSGDNTEEVVKNYTSHDSRIKYFYQEKKGRSAARNHGIEKSSGQYISFLDDDDYYLKDFLLEFYKEIEKQEFAKAIFMCEQYEEIMGKLVELKIDNKNLIINPVKYLFKHSNNLQPFCIPKVTLEHIKFDERFELGEDFHLLIRILFASDFHFIQKKLCVYVNHGDMTMEKELKDELFLKLPFNRLDMLDDIESKFHKSLKEKDVLNEYYNKFNKIAYFYGSAVLKGCNFNKSLDFIFKIKFDYTLRQVYFVLSILIRFPIYVLKCLISKKQFSIKKT